MRRFVDRYPATTGNLIGIGIAGLIGFVALTVVWLAEQFLSPGDARYVSGVVSGLLLYRLVKIVWQIGRTK